MSQDDTPVIRVFDTAIDVVRPKCGSHHVGILRPYKDVMVCLTCDHNFKE